MRSGSTIRPSSMKRAWRSAPPRRDEGFGHRHPFELPGARGALVVGRHGVEHQAGLLAHHLGAARISSQEIGLRFCGMVEDEPRPCTNGSNASPTSVCIISITSVAILASVPVTSPRNDTVSAKPSRATCQGDGRAAEPEFGHQRVVHGEALVAERGQRAGRAGELADQHARLQFSEALAVARDHAEPDRRLVAERHRQGVLQVRAAGHHRVAMLLGERGERRVERGQVGLDQRQRIAHLQDSGGVHDVLGGGAPVHVAAGIAALLGELVHEADDGIADEVGLGLELGEVDGIGARQPPDGLRRLLGDHADAGLGGGQRHLDLDVARDRRLVAEHFAHGRRAEGIAEDVGIEDRGGHGC